MNALYPWDDSRAEEKLFSTSRSWREHPMTLRKKVRLLVATSDDQKKWTVQFSPATGDRAKYVVHAALLGFGLGSKVKGGENSGTDSTSDFVVLAFVEKSLAKTANGCQGELELKRKKDLAPKRTAVAFWITPAKTIHPVQALGGWLSPTND